LFAAPGWFALAVSVSASRAAPNSFTRSGHQDLAVRRRSPSAGDASETSPCRRAGQAKRRAHSPKGDGGRLTSSGGIETSVNAGRLPSAAVAQLGCNSVVGPQRWAWSSRVVSAGAGTRANPKPTGSGVCRTATVGLVAHKKRRRNAVAGSAPVRRTAPRPGRCLRDPSHFLLLRGHLDRDGLRGCAGSDNALSLALSR